MKNAGKLRGIDRETVELKSGSSWKIA